MMASSLKKARVKSAKHHTAAEPIPTKVKRAKSAKNNYYSSIAPVGMTYFKQEVVKKPKRKRRSASAKQKKSRNEDLKSLNK